jgi:T5SS/PEP-CTERM-associated repeat protein
MSSTRFAGVCFGFLLALAPPVHAEKIWTNSASGLWQDGINWSGHTAPDITAFIRITNDLTKTVTINALTPATNLTVQVLTLTAPPGATNTLLLTDAGTNNPLVFQTGLELEDGAALHITNSALMVQLTNDHVNIDGSMTLDSGFIDFGDISVTTRVGRATSGVLTINGGLMAVGIMTIGGLTNSSGNAIMNGGTLLVRGLLSVGRNATTVGSFSLLGGQLTVTNDDTRIGDQSIGSMTISNATAIVTNLQVGRDPLSGGTLILGNGGLVQSFADVVIGRFTGSTGLVQVVGGQLDVSENKIFVGRGGAGELDLSNGLITASSVLVAADTTNSVGATGTMTVAGGASMLSSSLVIGSATYSTGQVYIAGGSLTLSNVGAAVLALSSGTVTMSGGSVTTDNLLLTNAAGQFTFAGGTVDTKNTTVANGAPFVVGNGVTPATLHLSGGVHSFANGLVISANASLTGCGTVLGTIVNQGTIATNCGPRLTFVSHTGTTSTISVPSASGKSYTLEYKNATSDTGWTSVLPASPGTGSALLLQDSTASGAKRFYRVLIN